jgi:hypothetical protein
MYANCAHGSFIDLSRRDVCLLMHLSMKQAQLIHDPLCMDLVESAGS